MTYFNTTNAKGVRLEGYKSQAQTQDQKIADFFELNPGEIFTPWEVQSIVFVIHTPITSVRRSINDLTRSGILSKTDHLKETGQYGRRSYCWTLNEKYYLAKISNETILEDATPSSKVDEIREKFAKDELGMYVHAPGYKEMRDSLDAQSKLFDVEPMAPVNCTLCGKLLTTARSIKKGVGPVCETKCT